MGMCVGRFIGGTSVAAALVVGSSWIRELSTLTGKPALGARRASIAASLGFGLGAGVAGALAQWAPYPTLLPYAAHILISLAALVLLKNAPETHARHVRRKFKLRLGVPGRAKPVFWGVIVPTAPWVFGSSALAFVVGPALVAVEAGQYRIAFAAAMTILKLAAGTTVQILHLPIDRLLHGRSSPGGVLIAALGCAVLLAGALTSSVVLVAVAAPLFGCGYGLCLVAGLASVQAHAAQRELAGFTAVFYALTYLGFFLPMLLAAAEPAFGYPVLLAGMTALAVVSATFAVRQQARLPVQDPTPTAELPTPVG